MCAWGTGLSAGGVLCITGATKEALKSGLSDMEYLRSKVAQTEDTMEESGEKDDGEEVVQHIDSAYESGDRENLPKTKTSGSSEDKKQGKAKKTAKQEVTIQMYLHVKHCLFNTVLYLFQCSLVNIPVCLFQTEPTTEFTVKLRGAPFNVKEVNELPNVRGVYFKNMKYQYQYQSLR